MTSRQRLVSVVAMRTESVEKCPLVSAIDDGQALQVDRR